MFLTALFIVIHIFWNMRMGQLVKWPTFWGAWTIQRRVVIFQTTQILSLCSFVTGQVFS